MSEIPASSPPQGGRCGNDTKKGAGLFVAPEILIPLFKAVREGVFGL